MNTALPLAGLGQDKPSANQHHAWLRLGELGEQSVYDYQGTEAISGCYQVQITLVCSLPLPVSSQGLSSLLQAPATLVLKSPQGAVRYVHGLVFEITELDRSARHLRYQVTLVPPLALLELRRGVRIFQDSNVPEIVEQLLTEAGLSADTRSWRVSGDYPAREYCVQYNETTLGFIERILAEAGIHYHFAHGPDDTQLILADGPEGLDTLPALPVKSQSGMAADAHAIHQFSVGQEVRSASVSLRDVDFTRPQLLLSPHSVSLPEEGSADEQYLEDYSWPGTFTSQTQGQQLADLRLARHRHDQEQARGNSDSPQLMAGHYQPLSEHPEPAYNQSWLITQLTYQGKQPQVLGELADGQSTYSNSFLAQPWTSPFRPPCPPKPQVPGQQSAIVTGPPGEEIYCDEYGRVKVQFYWDREGQNNEKTSTWLRVSQGWAGNGYGHFVLPRVGMEVLVSFINGDPDRPIITGCLFNGNNTVPYALPEHKTRSTFKTASSPGGGNSNELRFEDKADHEEIYLHAAKDYQERISHNSHSHILNDRQQLIEGQHLFEVRGESHQSVHGTRHWHAKADEHHTIDGSRQTNIANKELIEAGKELHYHAGNKIVINAGKTLTASGGGSFLKLDASGVTLVGPTVRINSGGSAGKGTGALPKLVKKLAQGMAIKKLQPDSALVSKAEIIVDVWGDPNLGAQVIIEEPEA